MPEKAETVRGKMTDYWTEHSTHGTVKEMMLDEAAELIGRQEVPEILGMLPDYKGKDVLELGAGIGRFTGIMAEKARSVFAVDFMEKFVQKNKEANGHLNNVTVQQADVTKLQLPQNKKMGLIFSNWLLMYLSTEEVRALFQRLLGWLDEDGYLFFRESCFEKSGNKKTSFNPTNYRTPAMYNDLLQSIHMESPDGQGSYCFETICQKSVQAYIKLKGNRNQICWLVKKVKAENNHGFKTFQEFLDHQQYSRNGILRYEMIFGEHFVSTGGKETTEEFLKMLDLKPAQEILDVGCGIGGSAFLMAQDYGARVKGIDLSTNMISVAYERANEIRGIESQVDFEVCDATRVQYPSNSFDVIYSRDTILHIPDKKALFATFLDWLKPGGKLLISDYCCTAEQWSDIYAEYVKQRGYNLLSVKDYGKVLESVGFLNVKAEDRTDMFVRMLHTELDRLAAIKQEFLQRFTQEDYDAIDSGWNDKVKRCGMGDQKWGLFYAEKKQ